jgi:hypothetical protein
MGAEVGSAIGIAQKVSSCTRPRISPPDLFLAPDLPVRRPEHSDAIDNSYTRRGELRQANCDAFRPCPAAPCPGIVGLCLAA